MSITAAILGLAVLILLHEAGHFVAARAVGMRPRKFYLGFGPPIVKTVRGGVEYGIAVFPLGGYVKIPGMHRPAAGDLRKSLTAQEQTDLDAELTTIEEAIERGDYEAALVQLPALEPRLAKNRLFQDLDGALSPDAYWRQATWKRIVVIGAGPLTNIAIAIALFTTLLMLGQVQATRIVDQVLPKHPAASVGLRAGDAIVSVDGHAITPQTISTRINATHGRPFTIVVMRDRSRVVVGPLRARLTDGSYRVGFVIRGAQGPGKSLPDAVGSAFRVTGQVTADTVTTIAQLSEGKGTRNISSSVGIVRVTSDAFRQSLQDFFGVIGFVSLAIALLNLLPILPLDGGHIVMSILEGARGRAFSQLAYIRYSAVGLTFFALLLYLGLRNDLFGGAGG